MLCILTSNLDIFNAYFGYKILSQKLTWMHFKVFKINMFIHFCIVIDLSNNVYFELWCNKLISTNFECLYT